MADLDLDALLAMMRDPNSESRQIADAAGCPREEAGRASRVVLGIARAKPEELLSLPGPLAAAAARAAIGAGRADLLLAVAGHASKDASREAKRGLHLLKSRGIEVPDPPRAAPSPGAAAVPAEPPLSAYASAIDGQGERAVWLPRILVGRGVEIAQAVLSDERGLIELQLGVVGRREWRVFARGLLERGATMGVAEIDVGLALAMIAAARTGNERSGHLVPPGTDHWLGQHGPAAPLPDPSEGFPPLPEDEEREAVERSGRLHDLPLLRGWLAGEQLLRSVAGSLDGIAASPTFADERQRAEQMARVVSDAVTTWFDAAQAARFALRLFETAAHLLRAGDPENARLAAAAARALRRGVPARDVPAARLLVQKAFPATAPAPLPSGSGTVDAPTR